MRRHKRHAHLSGLLHYSCMGRCEAEIARRKHMVLLAVHACVSRERQRPMTRRTSLNAAAGAP